MRSSDKKQFAFWNMDKEQEPGYSRELICCDTPQILDRTTLDSLDFIETPGLETLHQALLHTMDRIPNNNWLGEREGTGFKWMTWA